MAVAAAAAGSAAGAILLRRRAARRRDRAELYFADGSLVTLTEGSPEADRLLHHARELLAAARA
ncbi:MAG: hypothetical protein ACJ743_01035 [Gaiellaceae bacterium]